MTLIDILIGLIIIASLVSGYVLIDEGNKAQWHKVAKVRRQK